MENEQRMDTWSEMDAEKAARIVRNIEQVSWEATFAMTTLSDLMMASAAEVIGKLATSPWQIVESNWGPRIISPEWKMIRGVGTGDAWLELGEIGKEDEEGFSWISIAVGTDVICVVDGDGAILRRDVVASDPEVLAKWFGNHCPDLTRVVLETGPLSTFLYHGLVERAVPIECICARHAKGVLAARINKSDVHDAEGLAQLARTGWFKRVHMKASATHIDRAALRIRA